MIIGKTKVFNEIQPKRFGLFFPITIYKKIVPAIFGIFP